MRIVNVVGARPNFVKMAPLLAEMHRHARLEPIVVHTGQHYDDAMSARFFRDLHMPSPDVTLEVGPGSHATQTAEVMRRLEPVLESLRPDLVLTVGDVNSTLAAALTASKLGLRVAHVEAGLRSFDRSMPEEINRVVTDSLSDELFITEESARRNLLREGADPGRVHFVGNVMIDALEASRSRWERAPVLRRLGIEAHKPYALLTLHRPSNVDEDHTLSSLLAGLREISGEIPVLFPVHPRTRARLAGRSDLHWIGSEATGPVPAHGIVCLEPIGYLDCIALMSRARLVLTDSGGVQEESTILGVPCLTLRRNTERPVTVTHGTNRLVGTDPGRIVAEARAALARSVRPGGRPPLWDGQAARRIVRILLGRRRPEVAKGRSRRVPLETIPAAARPVWVRPRIREERIRPERIPQKRIPQEQGCR